MKIPREIDVVALERCAGSARCAIFRDLEMTIDAYIGSNSKRTSHHLW